MKTIRFNAACMAFVFALAAVLQPIKDARAIAPVVPLFAQAVLTNGARVAVTNPSALTGLITTVGAAIAYFSFNSGGKELQVPAGSYENSANYMPPPNPDAPETIPPTIGGFGDTSGAIGPFSWCIMDSNGLYAGVWRCEGSFTLFEQCAARYSWQYASSVGGVACKGKNDFYAKQNPNSPTPLPNDCAANYSSTHGCVMHQESGCAAGYISANGSCVLNDRRMINNDSILTYSDDLPGGFQQLPDADEAPAGVSIKPDGSLSISGVDEQNRPILISVSPMANGVRDVNIATSASTSAGTNVVKQDVIQINPAGNVTAVVNGALTPGTIENPGTSSAQVSTTGNPAQLADIVFPTDYARQGEAAAAASMVNAKLDNLGQKIDVLTQEAQIGEPPEVHFQDALQPEFNDLLAWRPPVHSSVCPKPTLNSDFLGESITMDSHCTLAEENRDLIQILMRAAFIVMALFIVLGA